MIPGKSDGRVFARRYSFISRDIQAETIRAVLPFMGLKLLPLNNNILDDLRTRKVMLTTSEAMVLLRIKTRETLCSWVRKGMIPAYRMPDNSYLFDSVIVADWIAQRSLTPR